MSDTHRGAVIVTGAGGSGCGRAIALRFARGGAGVVVSDISEPGGRETVRLIERDGGRAAFFRADVREEPQVRELMAFAGHTFGGIAVLVNNASATHALGTELEGWEECLQTDFLGTMFTTRCALEPMRRAGGGSIVNIASISALWHGRRTPGGFPGYDVAKAGVICMTTRLASLALSHGIRVNCLAPGWIASDGPREYWESLTPAQRLERGVPSKLLTTGEVAAAVVRLATDESLHGRVLVWWSEDTPILVEWGDRGFREAVPFPIDVGS